MTSSPFSPDAQNSVTTLHLYQFTSRETRPCLQSFYLHDLGILANASAAFFSPKRQSSEGGRERGRKGGGLGPGGWIGNRVTGAPLLPCPYMVMAELEAARPRPKSTSFSPVLKRDEEPRVKDVFLRFPRVVPAGDARKTAVRETSRAENITIIIRNFKNTHRPVSFVLSRMHTHTHAHAFLHLHLNCAWIRWIWIHAIFNVIVMKLFQKIYMRTHTYIYIYIPTCGTSTVTCQRGAKGNRSQMWCAVTLSKRSSGTQRTVGHFSATVS